MPGTHDSITYKFMNFKRGPASDEMNKWLLCGDYLFCLFCCLCNGCKTKTIVQNAAQTQSKDIVGQLNCGARYFDFRVGCPHAHPNELYFYHGYICEKFDTVMIQLQKWLSQHTKEIIIISFHRLYKPGQKKVHLEVFQKLCHIIEETVGQWIYRPTKDG